ncbi:hypothetical protein LTR08_001606 [Meristemomyces frigidus]|nr:hypothetical protein LTR08_001606 [Meristemomyces frigidus]
MKGSIFSILALPALLATTFAAPTPVPATAGSLGDTTKDVDTASPKVDRLAPSSQRARRQVVANLFNGVDADLLKRVTVSPTVGVNARSQGLVESLPATLGGVTADVKRQDLGSVTLAVDDLADGLTDKREALLSSVSSTVDDLTDGLTDDVKREALLSSVSSTVDDLTDGLTSDVKREALLSVTSTVDSLTDGLTSDVKREALLSSVPSTVDSLTDGLTSDVKREEVVGELIGTVGGVVRV